MENRYFKDLQLTSEIQRAIELMGFEEPTPIQGESIPLILEERDIVAQAPTGTGKTFAFGIPMVQRALNSRKFVQNLVLCPTRELVIQITNELIKLSKFRKAVRIVPVYGGQRIERQISALQQKPQIIVATPGRLMDHLRRGTISLNKLQYIVLDEADEMLAMGFREDIDTILETVPEKRQTVLFSATISKEIMDITRRYLNNPEIIKITRKEVTVPTIEQYYIEMRHGSKTEVLTSLLDSKGYHLVMVFCNTKRKVDELTEELLARGYRAEGLHGDMKQVQRDRVMARFKKNKIDILVATDVAARGIDIDDVDAVFNYDLPGDDEYYVHRIGRTGRANKKGVSYTFVTSREMYKLREIMRYTKASIKPIRAPKVMEAEESKVNRLMEEAGMITLDKDHAKYVALIQKYMEANDDFDLTTLDLAAAFLQKSMKSQYK